MIDWNGKTFAYDACGNPTTYKGNGMSWTRGRLLASDKGFAFSYDSNGERFEKKSSSGTTKYTYINGKLIRESNPKGTVDYLYGADGIIGCVINGVHYYYVKNMFGDVVTLVRTSDNTAVAEYIYDAWGNHKVYDANGNENTNDSFIGNLNPIRYRGYYWESDVQLYYLHTRWYDPEIGRFINLDRLAYLDPATINGLNLYAYCLNNPVMGVDPDGTAPWWGWVLGVVAAIAIGVVATVVTGGLVGAVIAGAAFGFAGGFTADVISQAATVGLENVNMGSAYKAGGIGVAVGAISGIF